MDYFKTYVSNTLAGSGNQHIFFPENPDAVYTGRVYYKVFAGGTYNYSLLFSNIIDSTYSNGAVSHANLVCDQWELVSASLGVAKVCSATVAEDPIEAFPLTFGGKTAKTVMPAEFFTSDPISITCEKDDYLCLEVSYRGRMIPYHEESIIPCFIRENGEWVRSKHAIFAGMIGCDRPVALRVGYLGDSITQGIGVAVNSYDHWNAVLSEKLGTDYAYWNLGLGFGRGHDAASDGAWLFKARQVDVITVCYGINDIREIHDVDIICGDLKYITETLQKAGVRVVLQSVPPADYTGEKLDMWNAINHRIRTELAPIADYFFDVIPTISLDADHPQNTPIGNCHPDAKGSGRWAAGLYPLMKDVTDKLRR